VVGGLLYTIGEAPTGRVVWRATVAVMAAELAVEDAVDTVCGFLHITRQSGLAGMGLSLGAMVVVAFGCLPALAGALFQVAIDLAVILNALRALRG
jgi:hypothetical protein